MAKRIPARLSRADGRRFAFTVGLAFLGLAALTRWRGGVILPGALAVPGAALLLAGTIAPDRLGSVHAAWMRLAHAISLVTTPILMSVVYVISVLPISLVMRTFGHRPLVRRMHNDGYWVERGAGNPQSDLTRQF